MNRLNKEQRHKIWQQYIARISSLRFWYVSSCSAADSVIALTTIVCPGNLILYCVNIKRVFCFWHEHDGCKYFVMPKTRTEFWQAKFERNKERDYEIQRQLASMGWHCITIWECQLKPKVREATLESLSYTLALIFLQNHKVKRYELSEESSLMVAEVIHDYVR